MVANPEIGNLFSNHTWPRQLTTFGDYLHSSESRACRSVAERERVLYRRKFPARILARSFVHRVAF
jgi:hypothetical protein